MPPEDPVQTISTQTTLTISDRGQENAGLLAIQVFYDPSDVPSNIKVEEMWCSFISLSSSSSTETVST
ncbi:hypothetical protein GG344DRAFT_73360 [Lentinula edodes]|nr:hypothetical protein GG344DRAFT_73360 [Lentinula edodes]